MFIQLCLYFELPFVKYDVYKMVLLTDPHIKVSGDPENVKKAKEKIMAVLDTKVTNRRMWPPLLRNCIGARRRPIDAAASHCLSVGFL